jgi:hypothetical protein
MRTGSSGVVLKAGARPAGVLDFFAGWRGFFMSSLCVPKSTLAAAGRFREGLARGEDVDLFVRIALRFDIALSLQPKATYHLDASNRTEIENCIWVGVPPYFRNVMAYLDERGDRARQQRGRVIDYVLHHHQTALAFNVLAGKRENARRILADFRQVGRYGNRQAAWDLLSRLPGRSAFRLHEFYATAIRGRRGPAPVFRELYRPDRNEERGTKTEEAGTR